VTVTDPAGRPAPGAAASAASAAAAAPSTAAPSTAASGRAVIAVDLGTTATKAGLVGVDGALLGLGRATYPLLLDGGAGRAEQDPDAWWAALGDAVRAAVREAAAAPGGAPELAAICVVGQGPTLVPTLPDGRAAAPAITWLDRRAARHVAAAAAALGHHGWTVSLLGSARFLAETNTAAYDAAGWFLSAWDHLAFRLTGEAAAALADPAEAPTPGEAFRAGLDQRAAPPGVPAGTILGPLLPGPAAELGLPVGLPVVAGVNDAIATFLGAGLTRPGQAIDTGGTSGGFGLYTEREDRVPGLWPGTAPYPGLHYLGGAMAGTGKALEWFTDQALAGQASLDVLLVEAAAVPPGADGLLFLPYLAGERWPLHDPTARGAFVGLTLRHGRGHLLRAVLEAAAYAIRHVAQPIRAAGLPFTELRVTGGTAASPLWNRIKADVLGVDVLVPEVIEASLVGAAVLAAAGVGAHADVPAAVAAMVRVASRVAPDPLAIAAHDRAFAIYEGLHAPLADANAALGALEGRA
jgi:xylulokinase